MILIEENFNGVEIGYTDDADAKKLYIDGVFMEAEVKNKNGRIYKREELMQAVKKINEQAAQGFYILGELDHPETFEVSLKNVSHKLINARMDGNRVLGRAEVIEEHPSGKILAALLNSKIRVGVSSRGSGRADKRTGIVTGFNLSTVDVVANTSCRSAYPETLREQLEMSSNKELLYLAESAIHDESAQKYFERQMKKFIKSLY